MNGDGYGRVYQQRRRVEMVRSWSYQEQPAAFMLSIAPPDAVVIAQLSATDIEPPEIAELAHQNLNNAPQLS